MKSHVTLVTAIAKKLDIEDAYDPEIDELSNDVHPEKVMDTLDQIKKSKDIESNNAS
jgi:hypothetical protein